MKHILIKQYNGPWHLSDLDYKNELSRGFTDDAYLMFRNSHSSINSYEIVDISVDDQEQVIRCHCKIRSYKHWASGVFGIVTFFESHFKKVPNIMVANEKTYQRIDWQSRHKVKGLVGVNFKLKFCIDPTLLISEYKLIFDEQVTHEKRN